MGVEFYIVDDAKRRLFDLGKGPWDRFGDKPKWLRSRDGILNFVMKEYHKNDKWYKPTSEDIFWNIWLTDQIWEFVQSAPGKKVYLDDDDHASDKHWGDGSHKKGHGKYKTIDAYDPNKDLKLKSLRKYCEEKYGPGMDIIYKIMES
jgi:hypothetical protein